jgi:iron complex outermembrane receptor protein
MPLALALSTTASAQSQISGTVFDAYTSARLSGVTVSDSARGTTAQTDRSGEFSLACSGPTTLVFRRLGYEVTQRSTTGCDPVRVSLIPGAQGLATVNILALGERPSPERLTIEQPQSVTMLTPQDLNRGSGLFLREALNLTPGIRMQSRTMSGGQTITIRGYGTGSDAKNFIGSGYKAYYNGIPITDAEGQTILDDVDFATLGRVDVVRGPASTIYGGGIGGVVSLLSALPHRLGLGASQTTMGGSDGLLRSTTSLQNVTSGATTMLSYGHQGYDSYRIHSDSRRDFGSFLGEFRPSDARTVSTFLSYAQTHELRAGELDSAQFAQKLNTGEDRYIANNARQNVESFRAGVTHDYRINEHVGSTATGFYTGNTLEDVYAAGLNSKSNQSFGARAAFTTDFSLGTLPLRGTSGAEYLRTNAVVRGYGMTNSVLGALRSDMETHTVQSSVFTQWEASLPADFFLTAGASANFIQYAIADRMANSANPTHADASGRKTFDPVITPRVALRKMFGPNVSLYANVSQGYSPPTASDAVIPYTGEPNAALDPERATQYEVGGKGALLDNRLTYQVALFDLRVTDKLSSQAVFDTDGTVLYSYTVNAGDQKDRGLEIAASYSLVDDRSRFVSLVRPFASYTYSDFVYENFRSDNNNTAKTVDHTGQQVVGVAPHVASVGLDAALRSGAYLNASYYRTDDMPISYDNAHTASGYSLVNAKVGFAHDVGRRLVLDAFVGGSNLGGSLYYTQVFLNHKFDTPNPHMYLPGPYSAKYYAGLGLTIRP